MLAIITRVRWLVVLGIGAVQFGLFFADLSHGEGIAARAVTFAFVSLFGGAVLGFFVRRTWLWLCLAASWGGITAGFMMLFMLETRLGVLIATASLGTLIAGGAVGALLRKFRAGSDGVPQLSSH